MTAKLELEIDKFGRVLIPKKVREALNLRAGDKVSATVRDGALSLTASPSNAQLVKHRGRLVFQTDQPLSADVDYVQESRDERTRELIERLGTW